MFFRSHRNIGSDDNLTDPLKGCEHKWKGFPMYINTLVDDSDEDYPFLNQIRTKYVCVKCKDFREETLATRIFHTEKEADDACEELYREYPDKIMEEFIVNAMVLDEQLLDREYLDVIERANAKTKEILIEDLSKLLDSYSK